MGPAVWELQKGLQRSWSLLWEGSQPARPVVLHLGDGHQQHGSPATTQSPTGIAEPVLCSSKQHGNGWQDAQLLFIPAQLFFIARKRMSWQYLSFCRSIRGAVALMGKFLEWINQF